MYTEPATLSEAVDRVNEAAFFQSPLAEPDREALAGWITSRLGKGYSYTGMPGLTEFERTSGAVLFTGERLLYSAKARHVMGEEAMRALHLLESQNTSSAPAIAEVEEKMTARLLECPTRGKY